MARFVDAFVVPVAKKNVNAYLRMARLGEKVWRDHGALEYRECVGSDLATHCGVGFPKQMKLRRGETVFFSWIVYRSRAHRDRVNAKVMKDPRLNAMGWDAGSMPFDLRRMVNGGFTLRVGG